jgi:hypothetical protein
MADESVDNSPLWQRLIAFHIGDDEAQLTFEHRLARENGWTSAFAERAVLEYKRFLYLVATSRRTLTPSDQVDQVWHLHLAYTRSYWKELCGEVLGFELHHQPTRGGSEQQAYFRERYADTLESYAVVFGSAPPADIWPSVEARFAEATGFTRINRHRVWLIPKPRIAAPLLAFALLMPVLITACMPKEGENQLWFWVKVAVGVWGIYLVVKFFNDKLGGSRGRGGDGGSGCSSGCGGCCGGGD